MQELDRAQREKEADEPLAYAFRPHGSAQEPVRGRTDLRRVKPLLALRPNVFPLGCAVQVCAT